MSKLNARRAPAQAISETLSLESKEKKLLDGFLAGKRESRKKWRSPQIKGNCSNEAGEKG